MHEFDLISTFFAGYDEDALLGIGDDAAVLEVATGRLAVAVDTLVAGVHFPMDAPADAIGHRALAVNLSDLAAMGATPRWMTLALTLPSVDTHWLSEFSAALRTLAKTHGVSLVGGDTTRGPLTITVQLMGEAQDDMLTRAGAQPEDSVYVSGTLGDSAGGLQCWEQADSSSQAHTLVQRFLYPQPHVALGQSLLGRASAAIDVSDGLLADLTHIAVASGVDATIHSDTLPLSAPLLQTFGREGATQLALTGGDDYVLCFTSPDSRLADSLQGVTRIGSLSSGAGSVSVDGALLAQKGYRHFE
ncbi:MAG: thiamine-phosphate kinase [Pseudomonadota bacterium]